MMCWLDYHLYDFEVGGVTYSEPDPEDELYERNVEPAALATLAAVAPNVGDSFVYVYDFGDDWRHRIVVEDIVPQSDTFYPHCTGGARRSPPEDSGGPPGYMDMLEIIRDPNHEEYEQTWIWLGDDFDPAAFDREAVNHALIHVFLEAGDWR